MNRLTLVTELRKMFPITIKEADFIVKTFFKSLVDALKHGNRVEIRGFGSLSVRNRAAKTARNPKTNDIVSIGERKAIYFRSGKELLQMINNNTA